jgi:hypothetical protein
MSIKNLSSNYTNNRNTFDYFSNENLDKNNFKKNKSRHLRDQFSFLLTELFKKEKNKNSLNTNKSEEEKKIELEILIKKEEKRINELKKLKNEKLIKVKYT